MPVFSGSCTSNNTSDSYNQEMRIISFSITNKTAGVAKVTIGIQYGSTFDIMYNKPLTAQGTSGCEYVYVGPPILLPINNQIFISVNANTDFYFSIIPSI